MNKNNFPRLAVVLAVFSAPAKSLAASSGGVDSGNLFSIIQVLVAILIGQAIIPAIKWFVSDRKEQRNFRIYLLTHVLNTRASYGRECSIQMAMKLLDAKEPLPWVEPLEKAGIGVPDVLVNMQRAINVAASQSLKQGECRYIPYISYFGVNGSPLDLHSPLWKSSDNVSRRASDYLITETQVYSTIEAQYSAEFLSLIKTGDRPQVERWCRAAEGILIDMAEHYVASIKLLRTLNSQFRRNY